MKACAHSFTYPSIQPIHDVVSNIGACFKILKGKKNGSYSSYVNLIDEWSWPLKANLDEKNDEGHDDLELFVCMKLNF